MNIRKIIQFVFLMAITLLFFPMMSHAQGQGQGQAQAQENQNAEQANEGPEQAKGARKFDADSFPSVLFTYWEQVTIEDLRRSVGTKNAPTDADLQNAINSDDGSAQKPPPEERDISLGGIAFNDTKSWTIWLNGERVTPKAVPEEILDLKVFKNYIEIKWFDEYTNRIIPIRLRPHQRFNIDTRIFLPG